MHYKICSNRSVTQNAISTTQYTAISITKANFHYTLNQLLGILTISITQIESAARYIAQQRYIDMPNFHQFERLLLRSHWFESLLRRLPHWSRQRIRNVVGALRVFSTSSFPTIDHVHPPTLLHSSALQTPTNSIKVITET